DRGVRISPAGAARRRHPQILSRGQAVEHTRHLGLDADTEPRDFMRLHLGNVGAAELHDPAGRFDLPGEELEERAFSGAVRPDQAAQLAFSQREIDLPHRLHAAEMLAQSTRLDKRQTHALPFWKMFWPTAPTRGRRSRMSKGTR